MQSEALGGPTACPERCRRASAAVVGRGENDEGVSLVSIDRPASEAAGPPEERTSNATLRKTPGGIPHGAVWVEARDVGRDQKEPEGGR